MQRKQADRNARARTFRKLLKAALRNANWTAFGQPDVLFVLSENLGNEEDDSNLTEAKKSTLNVLIWAI